MLCEVLDRVPSPLLVLRELDYFRALALNLHVLDVFMVLGGIRVLGGGDVGA